MKKFYLLSICLLTLLGAKAQTIENPSFESWRSNFACDCDTPDGWYFAYDYFDETKAGMRTDRNDAQQGNYAIKVQRSTFSGNFPVKQTLAFETNTNTAFTGYYKCDIEPDDSAKVSVMYKTGNNIVKESSVYFSGETTDWTWFQLKLDKPSSADSTIIVFWGTLADSLESKLWLDNVSFAMFVDADQPDLSNEVSIYPNPANHQLNVELSGALTGRTTILIEDLSGKQMASWEYANINTMETQRLNVSDLPRGVYILTLNSALGSTSKKIVLE